MNVVSCAALRTLSFRSQPSNQDEQFPPTGGRVSARKAWQALRKG